MAVLVINGAAVKDPQTLQWDIYDMDDEEGTGRNMSGTAFRDRIAVKRKLECTWGPLTASEMSTLLSSMTAQFFTMVYPDALIGATRSMTAYVGDRSAPLYVYNPEKGMWLWQGLSANFVEQ